MSDKTKKPRIAGSVARPLKKAIRADVVAAEKKPRLATQSEASASVRPDIQLIPFKPSRRIAGGPNNQLPASPYKTISIGPLDLSYAMIPYDWIDKTPSRSSRVPGSTFYVTTFMGSVYSVKVQRANGYNLARLTRLFLEKLGTDPKYATGVQYLDGYDNSVYLH